MNYFVFHNPTKVVFGAGMIKVLGQEMCDAGVKKAMLVAGGGSIRNNGVYNQVVQSLKDAGVHWIEAWGVRSNPTLEKAQEMIAQARDEQVDAILAVGGGSVIDSAKAVAAGYYLDDLWNAFEEKEQIMQALPVYAVLTLSATGSEMNSFAVLTNTYEKKKWGMGSQLLFPRLAIIDPSAQSSLPFNQTVNGALDAIAHILEYYFADDKAIATNAINTALLKTIMEMTDRLQKDPTDLVARGNLAWCATLALNGLSGVGHKGGDWACHTIEHAFSALKPEISHGEGLGVIFPAWIEFMSEKMPQRFYGWAKDVWGEENVSRALRRFREKISSWGAATSLRGLGIREDDLNTLLDLITQTRCIGLFSRLSRRDVEALLMLAF